MIDLFRMDMAEEDMAAVDEVMLRRHSWSGGRELDELESMLCEYTGMEHAVCFSSGTSALECMLEAHNVRDGNVVIPSFTFVATMNAVLNSSSMPLFADIENRTFGMSAESAAALIDDYTEAVMPVHFAGMPAYDIEAICDIAEDNGICVLEDAAEGLGSSLNGTKVGSHGDSAMFSFCQNKVITSGEGGAVVTHDSVIHKTLKLLRDHGKPSPASASLLAGHNHRMPSMNAALAISQLGRIERIIKKRRKVAAWYRRRLKDHPVRLPRDGDGIRNTYQMHNIVFKDMETRDAAKAALGEAGIGCRIYFEHLHDRSGISLPDTERISDTILSLPMHTMLSEDDVSSVCDVIKGVLYG